MAILYTTDPLFMEHDTGRHHPERPERLIAVEAGIASSGVVEAIVRFDSVPAPLGAVTRVHPGAYWDVLDALAIAGGGHLDPDTAMSPRSAEAALLAAGAGLEAVRRLDAGEGSAAFCAIRPPGHHATPRRPMGFCLINNVSVTAAALADRGERVLIVDYDAHHGNGTQDVFFGDDRVVYVSLHQFPFYPGTGSIDEMGVGAGEGATINVPLPAGATGDVYRSAVQTIIEPLAESWKPTWLLVSAGYDAHRADPLTDMGLAAADYADLTTDLLAVVPPGRTILFLEGGYDLGALTSSVAATAAALVGERKPSEKPTTGGPGLVVVDRVRRMRAEHGWS